MTASEVGSVASRAHEARGLLSSSVAKVREHEDLGAHLDAATATLQFECAFGQQLGSVRLLGEAFEMLRSHRGLLPWFYGGAAHAGWLARKMSELAGRKPPPLDSLDAVVAGWVDEFPDSRDVDLPQGALGLGVYGLAHPSLSYREKLGAGVLDIIERRLDHDEQGSFIRLVGTPYRTAMNPEEIGHRDLGVAHGNAGVLAYLSAAVLGLEAPLAERAEKILASVFSWFRHQRCATGQGIFPQSTETCFRGARCAWCYGDPGISLALAMVANALRHRPQLAAEARDLGHLAAESVRERDEAALFVFDACLCHGSGGLVYFGWRMKQATRSPLWSAYVERWAQDVEGRIAAGPLEYMTPEGMKPYTSFLEGDLGVALCLLLATSDVAPIWEERLLTPSLPGSDT
jgi:lantibiotic biosynthesis protein